MRYDYLIQSNFFKDNIGGVETVVRQIAAELGHKNICIFYGGSSNFSETKGKTTLVQAKIVASFKGLNILCWGNVRFFKRGLNSNCIVVNEPFPSLWPAILLLKFLGKKIKIFHHATPSIPFPLQKCFLILRKKIYDGLEIATTSPQLAREFESKHVQIVPLTISEQRTLEEPSFEVPDRYFLLLGRLGTYKGIDVLLSAIEQCPQVNFVIVGKGPCSSLISQRFLSKNKNLVFHNNFVSEEQKNYLLKNCLALLFPSTNSGEAFGIVQLEAMFYGKPIINTNLNTGVNFVGANNENAITIPVGEVNVFVSAINELWDNENLVEKLSAGALDRYNRIFSTSINQKKLQKFLIS